MNLHTGFAFAAALVMFTMAVDVFRRYNRHATQTHLLVWGIGMTVFAIASFAEALLALGWNEFIFILWYLCGAILAAAWLGHGTLYLLVRRKWVHIVSFLLVAGSVIAFFMLLSTRLDASKYSVAEPLIEQYRRIMPEDALVRRLTPIFNIYGVITLVGGALYSAFLFWRKRAMPNRVMGNVLIASGGLAISLASTLTRFGLGAWLSFGELIAALLIYAGFILASKPAAVEEMSAQTSSAFVKKGPMKKSTLGRILLFLGGVAWIPYFALKWSGAEVEMLPFLIAHLCGVVPGAILAPSDTIWSRLVRRFKREDDQPVA